MCSMFLPRSSMSTRSPFSVSSFAAHPPEIPEPTTIASKLLFCTASSLGFEDFSYGYRAHPRPPRRANMSREDRGGHMVPGGKDCRQLTVSGWAASLMRARGGGFVALRFGPPPMHTLGVTNIGVTKCGSQSRLLIDHDKEVRNQREGDTVPEKRPRSIEQRSTSQGEGGTDVHWVADEFVWADDDQAPRWIEYRRRPAAYDDKGADAPQRQGGAHRSYNNAGDLRHSELGRSNDAGP